MAFPLFSNKASGIRTRCHDDSATKLRLRYAPYYHAMEAQQGTTVRLQDRDLIMLASNDYLGLSFHPKVIEAARTAISAAHTDDQLNRIGDAMAHAKRKAL